MRKQQHEDSDWVAGLRQRHQEHQLGHEQVRTVHIALPMCVQQSFAVISWHVFLRGCLQSPVTQTQRAA